MAAAGLVDPSKAGKYPVILSDEVLGKDSHEIFTGIRYNPKPEKTPSAAKIKPTPSARTNNSYDLIFKDGGIHRYQGNRSTDESQYVLIFDPSREVFVLHRVDSFFNMNVVQKQDGESIQKDALSSTNAKKNEMGRSRGSRDDKAKKQQQGETQSLTMPEAKPSKPKPKKRPQESDGEEEEDSSDDDGGLVMEYPGGQAPASRDFSPAFPQRRFSEFVAQADEEEDDADGEEDDDDMSEEHFKLPSPMNSFETQQESTRPRSPVPAPVLKEESTQERQVEEDADADLDLEAELEAELQNAENQSESDVSEED